MRNISTSSRRLLNSAPLTNIPRPVCIPSHVRQLSSTPARSSSASLIFATLASLSAGYAFATFYPSKISLMLNPPYAPPNPSAESEQGQNLMLSREKELQQLSIVQQLRAEMEPTQSPANTSLEGKTPAALQTRRRWKESRPYKNYPAQKLQHHLTAHVLRGPGKLTIYPLVFSTHDETEAKIILHLGRSLCGHDGIVHGGMLATILDEAQGRTAILNLPSQIGVTANLTIDYKSPCFADQFVVVHSKLTKLDGRKAWTEARMETLKGELLAKSTSLFIEPKMAKFLDNSIVKKALGSNEEENRSG